MNAEKNRIKRRDKKRKTKMVVDDSARKLARFKRARVALNKLHKDLLARGENDAWFVPITSDEELYNGRSRPD